MSNQALQDAQRIIIKLGTQVVMDASETEISHDDLATSRLAALVAGCAQLRKAGREVILVSSGAVGLGRQKLGLRGKLSLTEKQACAAVGQNLLMDVYRDLFEQHGLLTAQVLLTAMDFSERRHYLNLRQTLETLLKLGVVPIINENDSVSTLELQDEDYIKGFGDNDKLSALVGGKLDAQLLVILTNVAGIYTENPENNPNAKKIPIIDSLEELRDIQTDGQSKMGRGGMTSKLEAARLAAISGLHTYITSGLHTQPLADLLGPTTELQGTLIRPQAAISGRKRWIGMASGYHGVLIINDGAHQALQKKQASLLPIGIVAVEGEFLASQVVSIQNERRQEIGRGLTFFSSHEIDKLKGCRSSVIPDILGTTHPSGDREEVIHRDNLVIFEEYGI